MIWLLVIAFAAGISHAEKPTHAVEIESVVWYYKPEQVFKRISEYFSGTEQHGRKIILRTNDEPREGLYFVVRIDQFADDLPDGYTFQLELLRADQKKPVVKTFPLPQERKSHREIWLGLTGEDTPPEEQPPVAWKVSLLDPTGEVASEKESFLWSKPPGETILDADAAPAPEQED